MPASRQRSGDAGNAVPRVAGDLLTMPASRHRSGDSVLTVRPCQRHGIASISRPTLPGYAYHRGP